MDSVSKAINRFVISYSGFSERYEASVSFQTTFDRAARPKEYTVSNGDTESGVPVAADKSESGH